MKLSVWSNYYWDLSPENAVVEYAKHGYRFCELSSDHAMTLMSRGEPSEVGAEFRVHAIGCGVEFLQGHLYLEANICEKSDQELLKRELDMFRAIGIKSAVVHTDKLERFPEMSLQEKRDANEAALRELTSYLAGTDIVLCIENMRNTSITKTADEILYFLNRIDSPNLGVCLDTGHLNLSTEPSQGEFIRKIGKRLKAIHITDNEGQNDMHIMPFGYGTVDFLEVLRETKKIGYGGLYNLEILADANSPIPIRGYKLEFIQKAFSYLDSVTD